MTDDPRQVVTYVTERDDEAQARAGRVAAAEDVAVAVAEAVTAGAAVETALQAGEAAKAMLDAAQQAAINAVDVAEQTAQAAADVAARNVTEVAFEAAATAAAMVTAAEETAREVVAAAGHTTAQTSPAVVARDIADRAAVTAEAMVAAATAAAVRAAERSRRDADVAADVAAQAVADIVRTAAATAANMVTAAAGTACVVASRAIDRARREAHVQSQADLLNAVFDGITDSVEVVDETGALLMHNRAATDLGVQPGRSAIVAIGKNFGLFYPDGITVFPAWDSPVVRALAGESSDEVVMLSRNVAHPSGVLLAVSGRPLKDVTGRPGAVVVSRDITAQHAQNAELETFAAVAAHDLRTPLAIVTGYLDIIADLAVPALDGDTADTVVDVLRRAQSGTMRMGSLIDDLLRYATRDAALVVEDVDLRARVDEVVSRHTEHLTPGTPRPSIFVGPLPWVRGDRTRITQVLDNLISNALKYTPPGQPAHLDITAHLNSARPGSQARIQVQIADRGIGIPAGQHAAVFTSFHRVHTDGPYSGTGLGLAICHRIVERHGGRIYATDNPGGGTRVHFTLPALLP